MTDDELISEIKDACNNGHLDYAHELLEQIQLFRHFCDMRELIENFEDSPDHGS